MNQTGDVAKYASPLKFDSKYRNCPCFHLNKKEFRQLVKNNKIPERVTTFSKVMGIDDIYMKNMNSMVTINYKKIKKMLGL